MTLLSTVQTFFLRRGMPRPSGVVANTDTTVLQAWGMANEILEDVVRRQILQVLLKEATFTTLATEDQGAISTIAPEAFYSIKDATIFNRSTSLQFVGPLSAHDWQQSKALITSGFPNQYRIRGDRLLMRPTPIAGQACAFEYYSKNAVLAADNVTYKETFTADDDRAIFDEAILQAGLTWKWKAEKGFDYAEEFRRYEELFNALGAVDGTKRTISMDGHGSRLPGQPIVIVPGGSILQ